MRLSVQTNSQPEENETEFIEADADKDDLHSSEKELFFKINTAREIGNAPAEISVLKQTNTSITLKWKINPCANDYNIWVSYPGR